MNYLGVLNRVSVLSLVLVLTACTARAEDVTDVTDVIKRAFKVQPGGTLYLDMDHGDIDIVSRGGSEVLIEVELVVGVDSPSEAKRVLEGYKPDFQQVGDDVRVRSRYEHRDGFWSRWRGGGLRVHLTAYVPERYNVEFTSGAGDVTIADLDGSIEGRTGAGNIKIGDVSGPVEVSSGSGNIAISGARERVDVSTGAGNVALRNVAGELEVRTGAGNIDAEIVRQPRYDSRLETGAGNVTVMLNPRVELDVDATAAIGSASSDFPLQIEGGWMKKTIAGPINGGGPLLQMRAGVGNVAIRKL